MDLAVSQDEEHLVDFASLVGLGVRIKCFEHAREQCWASKTYTRQVHSVCLHNALDAENFWILRVTIQRETMGSRIQAHVSWNSSETKCRELFVEVVRL